jgi:hypothetical protein
VKPSYNPPSSTDERDRVKKKDLDEKYREEEEVSPAEKIAFGEDVGKVGWMAMRTRPDIAFAVNPL